MFFAHIGQMISKLNGLENKLWIIENFPTNNAPILFFGHIDQMISKLNGLDNKLWIIENFRLE